MDHNQNYNNNNQNIPNLNHNIQTNHINLNKNPNLNHMNNNNNNIYIQNQQELQPLENPNPNQNFKPQQRDYSQYIYNNPINEEIYEENIREDEPKELSDAEDYNNNYYYNYSENPKTSNFPENTNEDINSLETNKNSLNNNNNNPDNKKNNNNNNTETSYKELLEKKIQAQAKRLCELQDYKILCENRIDQIMPGHPFPVNKNHLENNFTLNPNANNNTNNTNKSDFQSLNNNNNNENLQSIDLDNTKIISDKIKYLEEENDYLKSEIHQLKNFPIYDLKSINKSTSEKIRQSYLILQNNFQKLQKEKESILNTLREETINNEQQRNYIEILKQNIDTNLINNKLFHMINTQKNLHFDKNAETLDVILDIGKLQKNLEKILLENQELDKQNKSLLKENDEVKNLNKELNEKKKIIINSLEMGINELEEAKDKVSYLEGEKNSLLNELKEIKEFKGKVIDDYDCLLQKNKNFEKILIDHEKIKKENEENIKEIKRLNEDNSQIKEEKNLYEKKLTEIKIEFEKLNQEKSQIDLISDEFINNHNKLKEEYNTLHDKFTDKKSKLEELQTNLTKTQTNLTEITDKLMLANNENEKNKNSINEKNKKVENLLEDKEKILKLLEEKKSENFSQKKENENLKIKENQLISLIANLENEIENERKNLSSKNLILDDEKNINFQLKNNLENLNLELCKEKKEKNSEIINLKNENENLLNILEKNNEEIDLLKNEFEKVNQKLISKNFLADTDFEILKKDNFSLRKKNDELNFQIENYLMDIEEKKILIKNSEKDLETIKTERDNFIKFYEKEKYENKNNLDLIRLLEEEKERNSKKNWGEKKKENFKEKVTKNYEDYEKLETSGKNMDNNLDHLKISLKNVISVVDSVMEKFARNDNILINRNFEGGDNDINDKENERKKEENKQSDSLKNNTNSNKNTKENELDLDEIIIKKEKNKTFEPSSNEQKNSQLKEIKNFGEWFPILKEELKSCFKSIEEFEYKQNLLNINYLNETKFKNEAELADNENLIISLRKKIEDLQATFSEKNSSIDEISKELKSFKNDNKKLYEENKILINNLNQKKLDEKEAKFFEEILMKILLGHPNNEIKNLVINIIDLFDFSNNIEYDKIKLEKKLENLERELNVISNDSSNTRNLELENALVNQIKNMKDLIVDFEIKLTNKKKEMKNAYEYLNNYNANVSNHNNNMNNINNNPFNNNMNNLNKANIPHQHQQNFNNRNNNNSNNLMNKIANNFNNNINNSHENNFNFNSNLKLDSLAISTESDFNNHNNYINQNNFNNLNNNNINNFHKENQQKFNEDKNVENLINENNYNNNNINLNNFNNNNNNFHQKNMNNNNINNINSLEFRENIPKEDTDIFSSNFLSTEKNINSFMMSGDNNNNRFNLNNNNNHNNNEYINSDSRRQGQASIFTFNQSEKNNEDDKFPENPNEENKKFNLNYDYDSGKNYLKDFNLSRKNNSGFSNNSQNSNNNNDNIQRYENLNSFNFNNNASNNNNAANIQRTNFNRK